MIHVKIFLALLFVCLISINNQNVLQANGRVVNYKTQNTSSYSVLFGTLPSSPHVDNLHVSIMVKDMQSQKFLLNSDVYVSIKSSENTPWTQPEKLYNPFKQYSFEMDYAVSSPGKWLWKVFVNKPNSEENTIFEIHVKEYSENIFLFITYGIVLISLVIIFVVIIKKRIFS